MRFLRASVVYAAANVATAAVPFLLLPLLTRVLTPAEYGRVVSFGLLVTVCLTAAGLNAHAALGVIWFKRPHDEVPAFAGTAVALAMTSTLCVMLIAAAVLAVAPELAAGLGPTWGAMAALTAGCTVLLQCRLVLWQSQQKPLHNAFLQVAAGAFNVTLSLFAVLVLRQGAEGRNGSIALAALVVAAVAIVLFVRAGEMRWAPDRAQLRLLLWFGSPLIVHSLAAVMLSTTDRWMISAQLGAHALGVYGAGAQLGMVMSIVADAFVKAYGPWLYARLASTRPEDRQCAVGAIYTAMPMCLAVASVVGVGLYFASATLLGPQFRSAGEVLPWFVLGGAFNGVYLCTSVLYFFSGRTGLLAGVTLTSALVGVAMTWTLVATTGVTGAAMGYAATQGALALIGSAVAIRAFDLPWREPMKALSVWWRSAFGMAEPGTT